MSTTTMPEFEALINIQWAMKVGAPSYELAHELTKEIVDKLLSDDRFQEISGESIDIDLRAI